jgi:hypothetical protein
VWSWLGEATVSLYQIWNLCGLCLMKQQFHEEIWNILLVYSSSVYEEVTSSGTGTCIVEEVNS